MLTKLILLLISIMIFSFSFAPSPALATESDVSNIFNEVNAPTPVQSLPGTTGAEKTRSFLNRIVRLFYIFGAIILIIFILWGAIQWILSGGNKESVASARGRITNALIGFILLALSFLIVWTIAGITGTQHYFQ